MFHKRLPGEGARSPPHADSERSVLQGVMLLRRKGDKEDMQDGSQCAFKKKSLPLLRFSWSKCQYGDQSSADQLAFPCSSQGNLTSAEQRGPVSQTNRK